MLRRLKGKLSSRGTELEPEKYAELDPPKLVVAHFMVGNTAPYTLSDWTEDITLATSHEIDGFALNVGKDDWQLDQVSASFDAAKRSGTDFKLFLSFDMSSFESSTADDMQNLKTYAQRFLRHPNYLQFKGKALVSTFSGENSLFGYPDMSTAWTYVKSSLEEISPVFFIPSFFIDPAKFRSLQCIDGAFNWNGCWPIQLTPRSPPNEIQCPKLLSDEPYLEHLGGKAYMASVSPWFFTHYGKDSWNKNWIYRTDDWLFARRWEQLTEMRDHIDIVQVISWNDYGESHYVGPIKGAQPNSEAWVDGFEHTAWLHLCAHFARAFKKAQAPSPRAGPAPVREAFDDNSPPVGGDRVYVWARPHPKDAVAPHDTVGRPQNWELTDDVFWVIVFACAPATVLLWSTSRPGSDDPSFTPPGSGQRAARPAEYRIPAGLSKLQCALVVGGGIHVRLVRTGTVVFDFHPAEFVFQAEPKTYNFNAFVAMWPPE